MNRGRRRRLQKIHEAQQRQLASAPSRREVATYVENTLARRRWSSRLRALLVRLRRFLTQPVRLW